LQRNQFRFLLGFSNFLFIVQTGFDPVLNLKRFFLFIGVKLKVVSETHQTTSGCGFGCLTSVQHGDL
jgi:hypothetical protein